MPPPMSWPRGWAPSTSATGDVVAQAVLRLVQAAVLANQGADGALAASDAAELRLGELGLDAPGWRAVAERALAVRPAPV